MLCYYLISSGCKKEFGGTNTSQTVSVGGTAGAKDGFPNYPFNWETATQMMPNTTEPALNPSMPWSSQSGSTVNPGIISDYKSSDGWYLVYNTFNPNNNWYITNQSSGGLYFALYNIYRGILRFYLYLPAGDANGGSDIQHGLSVAPSGGATSILNFDGNQIVDANVNTQAITKVNNVGVSLAGGWYAMQYQLAYDPNFSKNSYPNLYLNWNAQAVTVSKFIVDGTQTGTLNGEITQQSTGFDWTGALVNLGLSGVEIFALADAGLGLGVQTGGSGASTNPFSNNLQSAAGNGLAGNITGFLDAITGGNSNNAQEIDLTMNTTIQEQGTVTTPNPIFINPLVVPGETIASTNSYPPLFVNSSGTAKTPIPSLGVFNLIARPTVYVHTTEADYNNPGSDRPYKGSYSTFQIDPSLLSKIQYNGAVTSIAGVKVTTEDLLILPTIGGGNLGGLFGGSFQGYETIGNNTFIRNPSYIEQESSPSLGFLGTAYVRLAIQVTPNDPNFTGKPPVRT